MFPEILKESKAILYFEGNSCKQLTSLLLIFVEGSAWNNWLTNFLYLQSPAADFGPTATRSAATMDLILSLQWIWFCRYNGFDFVAAMDLILSSHNSSINTASRELFKPSKQSKWFLGSIWKILDLEGLNFFWGDFLCWWGSRNFRMTSWGTDKKIQVVISFFS